MTARACLSLCSALFLTALSLGCEPDCDDPVAQGTGKYVVTGYHFGELLPGDEWVRDAMIGAQVTIDKAARTAVIRYQVDGATYEVEFRLKPQ